MEDLTKWPLLAGIGSPEDLRAMNEKDLPQLAAEIRECLIARVTENGGHLASNLGVVELTLAIHRVFDTPRDRVIFDVGHQSYVHKLLTGRATSFDTLREAGGLSGFTKRAESEHDAFGAGHSSTAISAAVGMAQADVLAGRENYTVAVVGDGALSGGLSYEGLNNCRRNLRLVLIINENEMSISRSTGRLARHLSRIRASENYLKTKEFTASALSHVPLIGKTIYRVLRKIKRFFKHRVYRENIFEHMGIRYLGPVDGNDLAGVTASLAHAKRLGCSVILHVKTVKGKGYEPAEQAPSVYHGLPPRGVTPPERTFSSVMGETLTALAGEDPRICAITAAMSDGTGLSPFRTAHPDRFFDVGIAEGHAVTFAAGLAAGGMRPVTAVYATFLQRAYDNVLHDAALQGLPVVLCVDRAGLNRADGVTHHGVFDVSFLGAIPNVRILAPVTFAGLTASLRAALANEAGVTAIRYPCGAENAEVAAAFYPDETDPTPRVRCYDVGDDPTLTFVTHGRETAAVLAAARALAKEGISSRVLLCEYLTPYPTLAREVAPLLRGAMLTCEEEVREGGFGVNLTAALAANGDARPCRVLAANTPFAIPSVGKTVWEAAGVDENSVLAAARELIGKKEN